MNKSKKIGFWYVCFLFGVLAIANPHEARSNSFVDSVKSFFSNESSENTGSEAIPVKKEVEAQEKAQVSAESISNEKSQETNSVAGTTQASGKKGVLRSESDILTLLSDEPGNAELLYELGQMKLLQGDFASAKNFFNSIKASGDVGLAHLGLSLAELTLGDLKGAYSTIVNASSPQDPLIVFAKSYYDFLLGQKQAGERLIQNAGKIKNPRLTSGILASYHALLGNYALANVMLSKLEDTGFLYAQALVAKVLSNPDQVEKLISEYRNKYQLSASVTNLIVANAQLLSFDYKSARKSFMAANEGASAQVKDAIKSRIEQLNNINDELFLNLHKMILATALKQKNKELIQRNLLGKGEALIRQVLDRNKLNSDGTSSMDIFEPANGDLIDIEAFNDFLINTITSNYFFLRAKEGNDFEEKRFSSKYTHRLLSLYLFSPQKPLGEDKVLSIMKKVVAAQEQMEQPYTALEATFSFYLKYLQTKKDFESISKIYEGKSSVTNFIDKFYDTSNFSKIENPSFFQDYFDTSLSEIRGIISEDVGKRKKMQAQIEGVKLFNSFKEEQSLTFEQGQSRLREAPDAGCLKDSISYYLAKRFKKETSNIYQRYLGCLKGISGDDQFMEQSVGVFVETLFSHEEYGAIVKFFETNEALILRASPFSFVHYVDSLGRSGDVAQAKKEAARLCPKVPAEICTRVNFESIPHLEVLHRAKGVSEAAKILNQVGTLMEKKNVAEAKRLLLQAKELDPINPFIYMYYEAIYRLEKGFDFLGEYTNLVSHYLTATNIEPELKNRIIDRIFRPCEDINLPCEILVTVIDDGHFKDVPQEIVQPAYAAQLIRNGLLERAGVIINEMTKSSNLTLQRKGIKLKASLTEILKHVEQQGSFDKNMIQESQPTAV